ncbi:MAG: DNA polymerase III subunit gamma/tau [Pseudomonadota bacterium]
MAYQVLALKYRPQTFKDVIGQHHVTTTLSNAILSNRMAHAILFSGPRGTGKTTIARILAKAMNCANGPTPEPCNQCRSCLSITSGNSADVFEIDGASNNSVDQVRELRENITYMPSASPYKIYIIDEVHMLSTAAFNALLKTLEEPPAHVIFIFATTEAHKIPVTILSRCQRHDLGRIPLSRISEHLQDLCTREGFTLSRESFDLIAAEADGSMRDALSLLDRILSSSETRTISHEALLQNLGIIDKALISDMTFAIITRNGARVLAIVDTINTLGLDLKKFYAGLVRQFRNLAVLKICDRNTNATDLSNEDMEQMLDMVKPLSQTYLSQILNLLITEEYLVKTFSHTRTALEIVFLKLIQIRQGLDIDDIIQKLDVLALRLESGQALRTQADDGPTRNLAESMEHPATPGPEIPPAPQVAEPQTAYSGQESPHTGGQPPADKPQPCLQKHCQPARTAGDWQEFLKTVSSNNLPFAAAILAKGELKEITETAVRVELTPTPFDRSRIESKKSEIDSVCMAFFGKPLELVILENTRQQPNQGAVVSPARLRQEAAAHPFIADALTLFNGTIVDVQPN